MGKITNKAVLIGIKQPHEHEEQIEEYLNELSFLAKTAGIDGIKQIIQSLPRPNSKFFLGKGKLESVSDYAKEHEVDHLIFDDELSPSQISNIEKKTEIQVLDRSDLILMIFHMRAQSSQAKMQVELAQMQYALPRLKRMWTHLERQRGATATRGGAGEKEIETDRRIIRRRIGQLKEKLKSIEKQSSLRRQNRKEYIRVALVGYTNVGKTTLMNLLSKSDSLAENKLFATLDTTVRKMVLDRTPFLLSDTVGFIRKLPHHLVESFKTTLSEANEADILIHVVDCSHNQHIDQINVVKETLQELKVKPTKTLLIFNKTDAYYKYQKTHFDPFFSKEDMQDVFNQWGKKYEEDVLFVSARGKDNIDKLKQKLSFWVKDLYKVKYPYKTDFYF